MPALLLLNPAAGSLVGQRGAASPEEIAAACRENGLRVTLQRTAPHELAAAVRHARRGGVEAIIVGGGDGTASTAARELAGSAVALGVLPLGTLNHFARDLGSPTDWREAIAALARAELRHVDLGEVNGNVFLNNCSIGAYPEAVRRRDALRRPHGAGKWWAMARASFAVLRDLRRIRLRIETTETSFALRAPFLVVANNRYAAHVFDDTLRPRLSEGRLWLYTTRAHRRLALLHLVWQALRRRLDRVEGLEQYEFTAVTVTQPHVRHVPIAVDGELTTLELPLRFRSRPHALRVLAPASRDATAPRRAPSIAGAH